MTAQPFAPDEPVTVPDLPEAGTLRVCEQTWIPAPSQAKPYWRVTAKRIMPGYMCVTDRADRFRRAEG